jgi:two-component system, OmpR family, sensor histidine kinase KdpD
VLRGRPLPAADRRILEAFAAQAAAGLRQQRLAKEAERTRPLAEADKMRTALLSAVSHDLRTPLSSARAAVDSLASPGITWTQDERAELIATARDSLERLDRLVANLLDMSRLQAGALGIRTQLLAVEEVIPRVLDDLGEQASRIQVSLPGGLPEVLADPALLERVLVNLAANAVRYSPPGQQVLLTASSLGDRVELRVADRGPGIAPADRDRVFQPFQRLGDRDNHSGVGLGLALARGLAEAMNGTLVPDDTPGGGLTMILTLPAATPSAGGAPGTVTGDETAYPAITTGTGDWRATSRRGGPS